MPRQFRAATVSVRSWMLGILVAGTCVSNAAAVDVAAGASAADYCSKSQPNSVALNEDRTILCFDGFVAVDRDAAAFHGLKDTGLFVMRSIGGYAEKSIELANILREKNAAVVLYDNCLSACANYFFVASAETLVLKSTVVAWHGGPWKVNCDHGTEYVEKLYAREPSVTHPKLHAEFACQESALSQAFFQQRQIDDRAPAAGRADLRPAAAIGTKRRGFST
jgi:hypothetical protein